MICTYCYHNVAEADLSAEHVFPQGLATIEPQNPFVLRSVCADCNSKCGRHVDAPYLKSWAVQNSIAQIRNRFSEVTKETILPLQYMGEVQDLKRDARICEFWLGPTGDKIYHFHKPYEQDENARVAVGQPKWGHKRNFDPGFVFVVIHSTNQPWPSVLINSCFDEFPDSVFYLQNGNTPTGSNRRGQHFSDIPDNLRGLSAQIGAMNGREHKVQAVVYLDAPDRFMSKLALGYGALFFHQDFAGSADAVKLRTALWTRTADEREKIRIAGRKFLGQTDPLAKIADIPGTHVLAGIPVESYFFLILRLAGGEAHSMLLSSEPRLWAGTRVEEGGIFVVAPSLRACVGPLPLLDYIADFSSRTDSTLTPHPELAALRARLAAIPPLPPF